MNEQGEQDPTSLPVIRSAQLEDLQGLRPILERWIRNSDTEELLTGEVTEVLSSVETSCRPESVRHYVVAESPEGKVLGMMGLQPPDAKMKRFATSENAGELINAYVSEDARGQGVGKALLAHLEDTARSEGYEELVVNSGPRYKETGWPFWKANYGEPVAMAVGMYGPGGDAMVWRKALN